MVHAELVLTLRLPYRYTELIQQSGYLWLLAYCVLGGVGGGRGRGREGCVCFKVDEHSFIGQMDLASWRRKNNLLKQMLVAKYGLSRNGWDTHVSNAQESCVWRGILYVKDAFLRQIRVRVCAQVTGFYFGWMLGLMIDL